MTKWGTVLPGLCALAVTGCVTVDSVSYGVPVDAANRPQSSAAPPPLQVSASEAPAYSTPYLGLIAVTFENHTRVWKQVDRVAVDFGSPAKNKSVVIEARADVEEWERAAGIRLAPPNSYADQPLLGGPFRVPPGMSATRWILLYTSDRPLGGCIDSMILSFETSDHQSSRMLVPFKVASEWQGAACGTPIEPPGPYRYDERRAPGRGDASRSTTLPTSC